MNKDLKNIINEFLSGDKNYWKQKYKVNVEILKFMNEHTKKILNNQLPHIWVDDDKNKLIGRYILQIYNLKKIRVDHPRRRGCWDRDEETFRIRILYKDSRCGVTFYI